MVYSYLHDYNVDFLPIKTVSFLVNGQIEYTNDRANLEIRIEDNSPVQHEFWVHRYKDIEIDMILGSDIITNHQDNKIEEKIQKSSHFENSKELNLEEEYSSSPKVSFLQLVQEDIITPALIQPEISERLRAREEQSPQICNSSRSGQNSTQANLFESQSRKQTNLSNCQLKTTTLDRSCSLDNKLEREWSSKMTQQENDSMNSDKDGAPVVREVIDLNTSSDATKEFTLHDQEFESTGARRKNFFKKIKKDWHQTRPPDTARRKNAQKHQKNGHIFQKWKHEPRNGPSILPLNDDSSWSRRIVSQHWMYTKENPGPISF